MEIGQMESALQGVLVIDFSQEVSGPYCTRLLAGLGAEVIKIERPGKGDVARYAAPFLPCSETFTLPSNGFGASSETSTSSSNGFEAGTDDRERSALFHHLNAGKKSVTLDLMCPKGRALARELIRQAHIVVENFAPGTIASLGLGYHSYSEENPSLVMTSISSFGQRGPYRDYVATNLTSLAMGGLLYTCGEPNREPLKIGGLQASYLAGLNGAVATLAALLHAEQSGEGQWIDVSVMESVVSVLEATTVNYSRNGEVQGRQGNRHGRVYPMTILPCKDGYIGVMTASDEDWDLFARLVGKEELLDPRFARGEDRLQLADEIEDILLPYLMERTRADLFHWAQNLRLPFSMVLSPDELLNDPQHRSRGFFEKVSHPAIGEVLQVGGPFKMELTPWQDERAPLLGEHTEQVLRELLNLDEKELWELKRERVI